jgi:hypothetical protein
MHFQSRFSVKKLRTLAMVGSQCGIIFVQAVIPVLFFFSLIVLMHPQPPPQGPGLRAKVRELNALKRVFSKIYSEKLWDPNTLSGPGSRPQTSGPYLQFLTNLLNTTNYRTVVDLGCGDWSLMRVVPIPAWIDYLGIDIVKSVIEMNKQRFTRPNVHFEEIYSNEELVDLKGDVLISKDVLQHWSNADILFFSANILPHFRIAILTNDISVGGFNGNPDIVGGSYRYLYLDRSPFFLKVRELFTYSPDGPGVRSKRVVLWPGNGSLTG